MAGKRVERLQIMLNEEELAAIDEWRFEYRMPSRSAAVRAMLSVALTRKPPTASANDRPQEVVPSSEVGVLETAIVSKPAPPRNRSRKIVVIEPERVASAGITTLLEEAGHEVVACLTGLDNWKETSFRQPPECAIIGDGLTAKAASAMADELSRHGIPFVYFKARADAPIPIRFQNSPAINTDSSADEFNQSLARICA